jgi:hypothetical protein
MPGMNSKMNIAAFGATDGGAGEVAEWSIAAVLKTASA